MGEYEFHVSHLCALDNEKASKYSVFLSRYALASGSSDNCRPTVASAMRRVNHPG